MKLNKLGTAALILFVFLMVVNAVAAEDNNLAGTVDEKLMAENENHAVLLDNSDSDGNVKLSAANSQETLKTGQVGNYTELKNLIDSNPNATISLDKDYAYLDEDGIKNITIPHSITINGNGHTISGENKVMSFYIPNTVSNVVLKNITFANGKGNTMLQIKGNHCLIDNCTFENNSASQNGAIWVMATYNAINNTRFINNSAKNGGAVYLASHDNSVNNCTFKDNSADQAGAVYLMGYYNSINNCTFEDNWANRGGAVSVNGMINLIYNSTFRHNNATVNGGAVHVASSNHFVNNCTFEYNHANNQGGAVFWQGANGKINVSIFNENTAQKGGAIVISASNVVVNNSKFYHNHASDAGAVYINDRNNTVDASTFEYNTADQDGGAVLIDYSENPLNNTIRGSKFTHNEAKGDGWYGYGGAIRVSSKGNTIDGCEFYNCSSRIGAGVSLNSNYNTVDNSKFENNTAIERAGAINIESDHTVVNNTEMNSNKANVGGAIYVANYYAYNTVVNNSKFNQNKAFNNGGAIYWWSPNGIVDNSVFDRNWVRATWFSDHATGGAICWNASDSLINNSRFTWNGADNYGGYSDGGAIDIHGTNSNIENCEFENNVADASGGAIRWMGDHGVVYNSTFKGNNASIEGGAIYGGGINLLINDSTFIKNRAHAYIGGALALDAYGTVDNSTFIENFAYKGGAIHWIDEGACLVNNSYFYNNHAVYAGGAMSSDYFYYHADKYIQNTRFINNTCVNYGGAIASLDTEIDNCTFINNSANMGGAIHSYDSIIYSSHFSDNTANYGNDIYHSGTLDLIDLDVPAENIAYVQSELAEIIRYNIGNSTRLMNNSYIGMCFERNSMMPKYGAYDESLNGLINVLTGESIVEYLKLLVYDSFNSMEDVYPHEGDNFRLYNEGWEGMSQSFNESYWEPISRTDYYSRVVHIFSDCDFRNSAHPVVKRILQLYDDGVRIDQDQQKMVCGTRMTYHFSTLMSPASQSLFLFLIIPAPKLEKVYLNASDAVYVNDTVAFNITVNNTGDMPLVNLTLREIYNPNELEYVGHSDNSTWIKNGNTFTYYQDPDVGDIIAYDIVLKNTGNVNLENILFGNVYNSTQLEFVKCANANVTTYGEEFLLIDEIKAGKSMTLHLFFKMLYKDIDLTDIDPVVMDYKLSQDNSVYNPNPEISILRNYVGRFPAFNVGDTATFTIWFKTLTNGTLRNNVSLNSIGLKKEIMASNVTTVYKPDLTVEKLALNKTVYVGNQTSFAIIVSNVGDCDLGDVTVVENSYVGLVFDSYVNGTGNWKRIGEKFVLDGVLAKGASASFTVVFNTTVNGTFTNVVVAGSNLTENKTTNNNTTVLQPNLTVEKIALNNTVTVYVGDVIAFNITVRNTGDCVLGDVVVKEIFDSNELCYVGHYDNETWIKTGNLFAYNGVLGVADSQTFTVWFKALTNGTLVNNVTARSNVTDEIPANNTTTVYQPGMVVEKIALNATVYVGDVVAFDIVVRNTGDCVLGDVTVEEFYNSAELYYIRHSDDSVWIKDGNLFVYQGVLGVADSQTFTVWFKALTNGTLLNNVTARSNVTDETPANNTTTVYKPDMTVQKIALNKTVYMGDQTSFAIIVTNTGDCDLGDVTVVEKSYDGLELDSYVNGIGSWKRFEDKFVLDGVLAKGSSASFIVIFNTAVKGNFTNVVVASSNVTENRSSNDTTEVIPVCDVEVIKLVDARSHYINESIVWTIIVKNNGPDDALNVNVTDILPDSLELIDAKASKGSYANGIWIIGTLKTGEKQSLTLTTKPTRSNVTITNTAIAKTTTHETNTTNNVGENTTQIITKVNLTIVKTASSDKPKSGEVVTWTITVTNNGPDIAENVVISDEIPDGLTLIGSETSWRFDTIAPGESVSVTVKTLVNYTGLYDNVATVTTTSNNTGENRTNKTIEVPVVIVEIETTNEIPKYGDVVNWTIVITNNGNETLENVILIYEVPDGVTLIEPIRFIGKLEPYQSVKVDVSAFVNTTKPSNITVIANSSNNITIPPIKIPVSVVVPNVTNETNPISDLEIKKFADVSKVYVGQYLTWTIRVINHGPDEAKNVIVHEYLPKGLQFVSYSASKGTYSNGIWEIDSISNGESVTLRLKTKVLALGNITNPVDVSCDSDYNLSNNKANATVLSIKKNDTKPVKNKTTEKEKKPTHKEHVDVVIDERQTANPIALLILALLSVVALQIERKHK